VNTPTASGAPASQLVVFWTARVAELRRQIALAERVESFTAVATLARQLTAAEVARIEAESRLAAEAARQGNETDAVGRIVGHARRLPQALFVVLLERLWAEASPALRERLAAEQLGDT